jgi:uncharacterized membrane protein YkvA (DUF1232 family)
MADTPRTKQPVSWLDRWKGRARALKREIFALYLAVRDPRCPWYARVFAGLVVAYAFSPIDLIPDFVPILGYLDDLILLPLGIAVAIRLIPAPILAESREEAERIMVQGRPVNRAAAVVIFAIWLVLAIALVIVAWKLILA